MAKLIKYIFLFNVLPGGRKAIIVIVFNNFISVHDDWYEQWQDNIDEETYEGVKIDPTVHPDWHGRHGDGAEGGKHVITIDQRKQTLWGGHQGLELEMIWTQYDPPSKCEANVEEEGTDEKAEHVRSRSFHGQYQNIVGFEKS